MCSRRELRKFSRRVSGVFPSPARFYSERRRVSRRMQHPGGAELENERRVREDLERKLRAPRFPNHSRAAAVAAAAVYIGEFLPAGERIRGGPAYFRKSRRTD